MLKHSYYIRSWENVSTMYHKNWLYWLLELVTSFLNLKNAICFLYMLMLEDVVTQFILTFKEISRCFERLFNCLRKFHIKWLLSWHYILSRKVFLFWFRTVKTPLMLYQGWLRAISLLVYPNLYYLIEPSKIIQRAAKWWNQLWHCYLYPRQYVTAHLFYENSRIPAEKLAHFNRRLE